MKIKELKRKIKDLPDNMEITMSNENQLRVAEIYIDITLNTAKISPIVLVNSREITGLEIIDEFEDDDEYYDFD